MSAAFTPRTRSLIITREQGYCVACGKMCVDVLDGHTVRPFNLQHRRPRAAGGTRDPLARKASNGIVACGSPFTDCHHRMENDREWAEAHGYLVKQGVDPSAVPVFVVGEGWVLLDNYGAYSSLAVPFGGEGA